MVEACLLAHVIDGKESKTKKKKEGRVELTQHHEHANNTRTHKGLTVLNVFC